MLILSKFRDYYDKATIGIDKELVYERKQEKLACDVKYFPKLRELLRICDDERKLFIVGFCGKLYIGATFGHEIFWSETHETIKYTEKLNVHRDTPVEK